MIVCERTRGEHETARMEGLERTTKKKRPLSTVADFVTASLASIRVDQPISPPPPFHFNHHHHHYHLHQSSSSSLSRSRPLFHSSSTPLPLLTATLTTPFPPTHGHSRHQSFCFCGGPPTVFARCRDNQIHRSPF